MAFSDVAHIGFMIPPVAAAAALTARIGVWFFQRHVQRHSTLQKQRRMAFDRLVDYFRREGCSDPEQAAANQKLLMILMERFRRYACQEYAIRGSDPKQIRSDWIKHNYRSILSSYEPSMSKSGAVLFVKTLVETINSTPDSDIFVYGQAARNFDADQIEKQDFLSHEIEMANQKDAVYDHVTKSIFDCRHAYKPSMG